MPFFYTNRLKFYRLGGESTDSRRPDVDLPWKLQGRSSVEDRISTEQGNEYYPPTTLSHFRGRLMYIHPRKHRTTDKKK